MQNYFAGSDLDKTKKPNVKVVKKEAKKEGKIKPLKSQKQLVNQQQSPLPVKQVQKGLYIENPNTESEAF